MTSGLCGTMDGDASNDFTTPNGTVLPQDQPWSVSSFAEAWRIPLVPSTTPVVDHAQQPWSWDPHTTNFNVNDPVDGQYTDESHVAAPTLAMTPAQETIVKTVCAAKLDNGTTADYVDCFYDYLQTLDPGFGLSSCVNRYGVGRAGVLCGSLVATTPSNSAVSGCFWATAGAAGGASAPMARASASQTGAATRAQWRLVAQAAPAAHSTAPATVGFASATGAGWAPTAPSQRLAAVSTIARPRTRAHALA